MEFLEKITKGESLLAILSKWTAYITTVVVAVGYLSDFFKWGSGGPFMFIREHIQVFWLIGISTLALTLLIWVTILHNRYSKGFFDKFTNDLRAKWDYSGDWRIAEKKTLLVTNSDPGGITKNGAQWENYQIRFKAKIVNKCLGVIVRAQDLNNYYMFQIGINQIVPHRRATVPILTEEKLKNGETKNNISFQFGWEISRATPIQTPLNDWFKVKIIIKGESCWLYINNNLVLQKESFLKIPTGKVGFRNWGDEEALIRDMQVIL